MPKIIDRCVEKLRRKGKSKSAAYGMCSKSTGFKKCKGGKWRKKK